MLTPDLGEAMPKSPRPRVFTSPCADAGFRFDDPHHIAAAAAICDRCTVASECLLEALRYDAAQRRGTDRWGITGVCGGVLFTASTPDSPGAPPRRVPRSTTAPAAA